MTDARKMERFATGVPGLDTILGGGPYRNAVYIVEGPPGAGKTTLANQVCFAAVGRGEKAVYYTLLTEAHDRMLGFIRGLSFFDAARVSDGVRYVSGFKTLEAEGLPGVLRSIREVVSATGASVLAIDGLVSAAEIAASDTAFKKFIHEIQTLSSMFRCTVFLLTNLEAPHRRAAEHTMVDGVIQLAAPIVRLKPRRTVEVPKFRGGAQLRGTHTLEITDDGIVVLPRIELMLDARADTRRPDQPEGSAAFGVPGLDGMLRGGLPRAGSTMLLGPSGSGKTTLGLRFLAGGLEAGETCLYFGFYEQPHEVLQKADDLGVPLRGHHESGRLLLEWHSAVEASVDRLGHRLLELFERHRPSRLVLDGIHGFQATADPPERIQDFFAALADYVQAAGIAMMFTVETRDLVGHGVTVPFTNASVMTQACILLRLVELDARLRHTLCLVKLRSGEFDSSIRTLAFGERGVDVGEVLEGADQLLSGLPRRLWREGG